MKLKIGLIILIAIKIAGCEFHPDEVKITKIERPQSSDAPIIHLSSQVDSVYVFDKVRFDFEIEGENNLELYDLFFETSDKKVQLSVDNSFYVDIEPSDFKQGKNDARVVGYFSTGSGSLADKLGAEAFEVVLDFVMFVDTEPIQPVEILNVYPNNGILKIDVSSPSKLNFKEYRLRSRIIDQNGNVIGNKGCNKLFSKYDVGLTDIGYTGVKCQYWVEMAGYNWIAKSDYYDYELDAFPLTVSYLDGKVKIEWSDFPIFNNNIDFYVTGTSDVPIVDPDESGEILLDQVIKFGTSVNVGVSIVSRDILEYGWLYDPGSLKKIFNTFPGKRMRPFGSVSLTDNGIYLFSNGVIYKHDKENLAPIDSSTFFSNVQRMAVSSDGSYLYLIQGSDVVQVDPFELDEIGRTNIEELFGFKPEIYEFPSVSNNNILLITNGSSPFSTYLIDLHTNEIVFSSSAYEGAYLSPDGTYFVFGTKVFHIENNIFNHLYDIKRNVRYRESRMTDKFTKNSQKYIYYGLAGTGPTILDLQSGDETILSMPSYSSVSVNQDGSYFYVTHPYESPFIEVFNVDGMKVKNLDAHYDPYQAPRYWLFGSKILSSRGYYDEVIY